MLTAVLALLALASWTVASAGGRRPRWMRHSVAISLAWAGGLVLFGALRLLPALAVLRP